MPGPIINEVAIANSALLKVGAQEISSFDDDTRSSNICQSLFYILRDEVMRAVPWRFALQQLQLMTPNGTAPAFGYLAAYDIPDTILRVLNVDSDPWTVMGTQIFCNTTDGINTLNIFRNENAQAWDSQFAEALAWRLAIEIALGLVQSAPMKQEMEKGYDKALALARSTNAVVGTPERLRISEWASARKYQSDSNIFNVDVGPVVYYEP